MGGEELFFGGLLLIGFISVLGALAIDVWALVDCGRRSESDFEKAKGTRDFWLLILSFSLFFGFVLLAAPGLSPIHLFVFSAILILGIYYHGAERLRMGPRGGVATPADEATDTTDVAD